MRLWSARFLFVALFALIVCGVLSPPLALTAGIALGLTDLNPFDRLSRVWARILLQASVVALGFGMNAQEIVKAGRGSFVYTIAGIALAMTLGWLFGILLRVNPKVSFLISAGTAICGGSAIAALASVTNPDDDEMAMSLGTVFTLNSIALLIFPLIGVALQLTQNQFGLWSALAIHDTSSVVGASSKFGAQALKIATVVKLSRALWILPVTMLTALINKSDARVKFPWFIAFFVLAAIANTWLSGLHPLFGALNTAGHRGLELTLFLIGAGINLRALHRIGGRAMLHGVLLWILVASVSLFVIKFGWFSV